MSSLSRLSFSANRKSFELFHVLTDGKVTDSSRRICRIRSRRLLEKVEGPTIGSLPAVVLGRERAKETMALRIVGVNFGSGPGLFFG